MAIANIIPGVLYAVGGEGAPGEESVTIVRPGGQGWAFAEVQLAWVTNNGNAQTTAWISGVHAKSVPEGNDLVWFDSDPGGSQIVGWFENCVSVTFTLRVSDGWAAAIVKLSPWQ